MKPTIGMLVNYVQEKPPAYQPKEGPRVYVHLPAIITAVWSDTCVNLQVFTDGTNSDDQNMSPIKWLTSRTLSIQPQNNTWHWPERKTTLKWKK